jgi:hypothetical protein
MYNGKKNAGIQNHYNKTPLMLINWDSKPSGHAENLVNWIFV